MVQSSQVVQSTAPLSTSTTTWPLPLIVPTGITVQTPAGTVPMLVEETVAGQVESQGRSWIELASVRGMAKRAIRAMIGLKATLLWRIGDLGLMRGSRVRAGS